MTGVQTCALPISARVAEGARLARVDRPVPRDGAVGPGPHGGQRNGSARVTARSLSRVAPGFRILYVAGLSRVARESGGRPQTLGEIPHSPDVLTGFLFHFAKVDGDVVSYDFAKFFDVSKEESCWIHVYLNVKNRSVVQSSTAKIECSTKNQD